MTDFTALTDQELVIQTAAGESEAYGCLYDRYVEQIYRFVFFRVNNRQDAEDLTEAVFIKTLEAIQEKRTNIESVKAWLYRSAKNLVIDYYRTQKSPISIDHLGNVGDKQSSPESQLIIDEDQRRLQKAMDMLEPDQQLIIIYRFINRLSHEETAQILGIRVGTMRVLQYRILKKLRKILEEFQKHE
jgi:RNA polymerase sigma-70 factor, ECF subfamily